MTPAEVAAGQHPGGARIYRRLLGYVWPHWRYFAVAVFGMVVFAATEPAFAALMKPLLDGSFVERDAETIRTVPILLVALFVLRGVASFLNEYFMKWVGRKVVATLRCEIFAHLLQAPARFFDNNSSGLLVGKLVYNVEQVAAASTNAVTSLIRDSLSIVLLLGWMLYLNAMLAMIFLLVGPTLALALRYAAKRFRRLSKCIQDSVGDIAHSSQEIIEAQRVVKSFGGHDYETERFRRINERNRRQSMKMIATDALSSPVVQLISAVAMGSIVYLSTMEGMREQITVGTFMSFVVAMGMLLAPVKRLASVNVQLQRGITAAESIFELLDSEQERDAGTLHLERAHGAIEFRELSHAYSEEAGRVLNGVNLKIEPGQTVAFVGRSGSGKTTLVSLLLRFYDPSQGEILIDGAEIRQLQLASLRTQIAMVGQDVTLFNDTVARNIAYGQPGEADAGELREAARSAHALQFIEALPQGMDTLIGDDGVLLSGGQRQRLAIARAILKDAPILVLDEATSSLDTQSERHIQAALENLMRHRTTLVIAHRLSTIENADRIVVMHEGRIVEQGRHAELLAHDGHYAELHRLQFHELDADAPPA